MNECQQKWEKDCESAGSADVTTDLSASMVFITADSVSEKKPPILGLKNIVRIMLEIFLFLKIT